MWITVLGIYLDAIKHIVNNILKLKKDNSAAGVHMWILKWKDRVLHRQEFKNASFLFCTKFIHIESIPRRGRC